MRCEAHPEAEVSWRWCSACGAQIAEAPSVDIGAERDADLFRKLGLELAHLPLSPLARELLGRMADRMSYRSARARARALRASLRRRG